ncbi:MAG: ATP-binding protein [Bacteroidota bacterium]
MLIDFSVGNFRSFRDIETLTMQSAKIKSKYKEVDENNVFQHEIGYSLLKTKGIFGANASGKSNLIRAFAVFVNILKNSVKDETVVKRYEEPFFLDNAKEERATFFQATFILDNQPYRYGFEIKNGNIKAEWLFGTPKERETHYFVRESMNIEINKTKFKEGQGILKLGLDDLTVFRNNSLFLGVVATFGGKNARQIINFFTNTITILSNPISDSSMTIAFNRFDQNEFRERLTDLMLTADMGITGMQKVDVSKAELSNGAEQTLKGLEKDKKLGFILLKKPVFNEAKEKIGETGLPLNVYEAEGTKKLFALSPFIFDTLANENGGILVIDELDARLHPRLSHKIVQLFNSKETNPNNAQLIFVAHDTSFLNAKLLRRDQITFVEKDKYGNSSIYTLVEYKGVRNDASFEQDYLKGKYGAVPFLNGIDRLFL